MRPDRTVQESSPSLEPLETADGICRVCPRGPCSLVEAVDLVRGGIEHCRERRIGRLLFNGTGLTGVPVPSLVDRFLMVEEWAFTAQSMVAVALVVHAEYIHPRKFGMVVAADLGLTCNVLTTEEDALRWLADLMIAATGNH
jgi:hypothetical protein